MRQLTLEGKKLQPECLICKNSLKQYYNLQSTQFRSHNEKYVFHLCQYCISFWYKELHTITNHCLTFQQIILIILQRYQQKSLHISLKKFEKV